MKLQFLCLNDWSKMKLLLKPSFSSLTKCCLEGAEASPVYLLRLINSVKRRSISNVILGFLSSIHVFGQCLLGSRPLTLHQQFKFCQTIQTMSAQSAYQTGSASDSGCDSSGPWKPSEYFRNISGFFILI